MSYIFVYGTLMKKCKPNKWSKFLRDNAEYIGEAEVAGELYKIDFYPGLIKGSGKVFGELFELKNPNKTLPILDDYEDFNDSNISDSLYTRELCNVRLTHNDLVVEAWAYYFNGVVSEKSKYSSGRFLN